MSQTSGEYALIKAELFKSFEIQLSNTLTDDKKHAPSGLEMICDIALATGS